jgi:hypothetical protein
VPHTNRRLRLSGHGSESIMDDLASLLARTRAAFLPFLAVKMNDTGAAERLNQGEHVT